MYSKTEYGEDCYNILLDKRFDKSKLPVLKSILGKENKGVRAYHINVNMSVGVRPPSHHTNLQEYYSLLQDADIDGVHKVLSQKEGDNIRGTTGKGRALTLDGFLCLNRIFLERNLDETSWLVSTFTNRAFIFLHTPFIYLYIHTQTHTHTHRY